MAHVITSHSELESVLNEILKSDIPNVLISGETGIGKTYGVEMASKKMGLSYKTALISSFVAERLIGQPSVIEGEYGLGFLKEDKSMVLMDVVLADEMNRRLIPEPVLFSLADRKGILEGFKGKLITTINPPGIYHSCELCPALRGRFLELEFAPTVDSLKKVIFSLFGTSKNEKMAREICCFLPEVTLFSDNGSVNIRNYVRLQQLLASGISLLEAVKFTLTEFLANFVRLHSVYQRRDEFEKMIKDIMKEEKGKTKGGKIEDNDEGMRAIELLFFIAIFKFSSMSVADLKKVVSRAIPKVIHKMLLYNLFSVSDNMEKILKLHSALGIKPLEK